MGTTPTGCGSDLPTISIISKMIQHIFLFSAAEFGSEQYQIISVSAKARPRCDQRGFSELPLLVFSGWAACCIFWSASKPHGPRQAGEDRRRSQDLAGICTSLVYLLTPRGAIMSF